MSDTKLQVGDQIEILGWVMLAKLQAGRYRIARISQPQRSRFVYHFSRPNGKKVVWCHYAEAVDPWVRSQDDPDINKIVKL